VVVGGAFLAPLVGPTTIATTIPTTATIAMIGPQRFSN
jgi:hypothetical protein